MNNNLTYREKFTCEMIWGSIPMTKNWEKPDTDYIRGSKIFQDGLKQFDKGEWRSLEKEIWKDVVGYEGYYKVSNLGDVRSIERNGTKIGGQILSPFNSRGYIRVILSNNNIYKKISVHRLVALAFIPNPENKPCVNHINGIKSDNRIENLEWCTIRENNVHAFNMGLKTALKGENHIHSKLTSIQVNEIRNEFMQNRKRGIKKALSLKYNVSLQNICNVIKGKSYTNA